MQKKKQGISLIVLVITIIVMIILAATIIISLNNNGIISKASEAVDKTNEKQVEELASLAWANAYADNVGKSDEELQAKLQEAVEKALEDNGIDTSKYYVNVTITGVTLGWLQTADRTVIKGNTTLNIGDYVNYTSGVEGYTDTNGWQVLGAENGELLIMSASNINDAFNLVGIEGYEHGVSNLNEECAPYGKGAYATKARSITVEDIDRVTGYDKTTYGKETITEYGNVVTYSYNGNNPPTYSGSNGITGTLSSDWLYTDFWWYDLDNVCHMAGSIDLKSSGVITADGVEAKVKNTFYTYYADLKTDLAKGTNAYNMLFGSTSRNHYWLASQYSYTDNDRPDFGLRAVRLGMVDINALVFSSGQESTEGYGGVRAVVQLSSDLKLTGSSSAGWSIV